MAGTAVDGHPKIASGFRCSNLPENVAAGASADHLPRRRFRPRRQRLTFSGKVGSLRKRPGRSADHGGNPAHLSDSRIAWPMGNVLVSEQRHRTRFSGRWGYDSKPAGSGERPVKITSALAWKEASRAVEIRPASFWRPNPGIHPLAAAPPPIAIKISHRHPADVFGYPRSGGHRRLAHVFHRRFATQAADDIKRIVRRDFKSLLGRSARPAWSSIRRSREKPEDHGRHCAPLGSLCWPREGPQESDIARRNWRWDRWRHLRHGRRMRLMSHSESPACCLPPMTSGEQYRPSRWPSARIALLAAKLAAGRRLAAGSRRS